LFIHSFIYLFLELRGAQLTAIVSYGGNVLQQVPVATSDVRKKGEKQERIKQTNK
jgi:hypothetical protein